MLASSSVFESLSSIPWQKKLSKSYSDNFTHYNDVFVSMSKLKRSGDVAMHCLPFRGLLEDDSHFLKFQLAINDSLLMGDIKADPKAKLSWIMPKTKEYYNITGKFYIASAPTQLTRFPPPKISSNDGQTTADYWEQQRLNEWNKLSSKARATFTWPSRAETPKSAFKSFNCQSLDKSQKSVLHEIALDNFCLLVFKVTDVEHLDYSCFPPKRTLYIHSAKADSWDIQSANP